MVVQHNISAMNANRLYGVNNSGLSKSLEKLSSGYAINRAGDNAAGLAVSEKMRAQISGLTQASKNAEDGISMVQTYEGALQESDSILQRMRTLAVQSANGTYQDDVDREAIQLEYDQLNDELDQIADTDFNGVVALNGGQMADGLKAVDNEFDYANKQSQIMAQAKQTLRDDVAAANSSIQDAQKAMKTEKFDLSADGDAPEWNTVDDSGYTKGAANELWKDAGITKTVNGKSVADTSTVTELTATFEFDGTNWTTKSIVGNDGKSYDTAALVATAAAKDTAAANATGLGGFTLKTKSKTDFQDGAVNAVFDATNAKAGDTVTLTFTNGADTQLAPKNIAWADDTVSIDDKGDGTNALAKPTLSLGAVKDADMTADLADAYNALNGQSVTLEYGDNNNTNNPTVTIGDSGALTLTSTAQKVTINGQDYQIATDNDTAATKITISDTSGKTPLMEIAITTPVTNGGKTGVGTYGTVSGTIALDTALFTDASAAIDVSAGKNEALGTSTKYQQQISDARDKLAEYANVNVSDYESAKAYLDGKGVSVSDSNDASTATLTYSNNVTLQVGARTKDSVNFTFKYSSSGLGDLEADLNCSASGLGTDQLSVATQEDANAAIDKIDNAINKVSMVRATFGAVQNRLEHKITNLDTNNENLTAAESRIRDTDMAEEMTNFTKNQILAQASQAMLAQANQLPQGVLQLLG